MDKTEQKPEPSFPSNLGGEARLRAVIDAAPNAMVIVDETGSIKLVNKQAERLFDYSREQLMSMSVDQLVPERMRTSHEGYRQGFLSNPDARAMGAGRDLFGLRSDGSEVPIEIGLNPLHIEDRLFVIASIIDITERKNTEQSFRLMVEAAPNAMLMVDPSGKITHVNVQTEKLFGYPREELLGEMVEKLVPDTVRGRHPQLRDGFFGAPEARSMGVGRDLYGVTKDGREVPLEIGLNPIETPEGTLTLASIIDISERKKAEQLMLEQHENLLRQSIFDSIPFSVIAMDVEGRVIAVNPATVDMLGYSQEEIIGASAAALFFDTVELQQHAVDLSRELGEEIAPDHNAIVAQARRGVRNDSEWTYRRRDGMSIPIHLTVTPLRSEEGEITGYLKVAYDITERKRTEAYIMHMAHHDPLTGLPNRVLLMDRLDMAIKHAGREGHQVGVLLMDLDHFKRVNDSLGHHVGDQLLISISRRLQSRMRESDSLARLGGDEFVLVIPNIHSREKLDSVVDMIFSNVSTPVTLDTNELLITPSIGGSIYPDDGEDANMLIRNADAAMYAAKASGRSNIQWFNEDMLRQNQEKLTITSALMPAIENNEFSLNYQPEIDLESGRVAGMEALIRWHSQELGEVSPAQFIPLAEEAGMILPIGDWVLKRACADAVKLSEELGYPIKMAVNVSPRQLRQDDWLEQLSAVLETTGLPAEQLELEITEGTLIEDPTQSAELLREIQHRGHKVIVDDFGTGYSSLSYLTRFPIDKIKIDRSFIRDLYIDATDAAIVEAIIAMAHSLNIRVIAEGVETSEQMEFLRARGCEEVQGFYYSPAVSVEEVPALVERIHKQTK